MTESDSKTDNDQQLCFRAYALNLSFQRYFQAIFGETGLTFPKYVILTALSKEGPMTVSQLSAKAGVEANTLSPLLKRMESFDVLSRERSQEDERRVVISLRPFGKELYQRAETAVIAGFSELGLDPEDVTRTLGFLSDVQARLEKASPGQLDISDIAKSEPD